MCIHRNYYKAGAEGDNKFVNELASSGDPWYAAAARLFQKKIDAGVALTDAVQDAVFEQVSAADADGTLATVGA